MSYPWLEAGGPARSCLHHRPGGGADEGEVPIRFSCQPLSSPRLEAHDDPSMATPAFLTSTSTGQRPSPPRSTAWAKALGVGHGRNLMAFGLAPACCRAPNPRPTRGRLLASRPRPPVGHGGPSLAKSPPAGRQCRANSLPSPHHTTFFRESLGSPSYYPVPASPRAPSRAVFGALHSEPSIPLRFRFSPGRTHRCRGPAPTTAAPSTRALQLLHALAPGASRV